MGHLQNKKYETAQKRGWQTANTLASEHQEMERILIQQYFLSLQKTKTTSPLWLLTSTKKWWRHYKSKKKKILCLLKTRKTLRFLKVVTNLSSNHVSILLLLCIRHNAIRYCYCGINDNSFKDTSVYEVPHIGYNYNISRITCMQPVDAGCATKSIDENLPADIDALEGEISLLSP